MNGEVKDFLDSFKPSTRKVYSAGLNKFLEFYRKKNYGRSIEDFLDAVEKDMSKPRRQRYQFTRNVLREFIDSLKSEGYAPKTIRSYINAIQSLGTYYGISISTRYVGLPSSQPLSKKYPWTVNEAGKFIMSIQDAETRSIAATILQSGISLGDLLLITWGDIKREYRRSIVPLCFDLARKKTDVPYMTFIGSWGFKLLKKHLGDRLKSDDDPIYNISQRTVEHRFRSLSKKFIGKYEGMNPCRPHSLRAAFRTFLGDAGMQETYIEFFMGHRLPEHRAVYVSKSREGWRETYKKYESYLTPNLGG